MFGLFTCVFIKNQHNVRVDNVRADYVGAGVMCIKTKSKLLSYADTF